MKTYEIHEKIKLQGQKSTTWKYIGEVNASSVKEATSIISEREGIQPSKLVVKYKFWENT